MSDDAHSASDQAEAAEAPQRPIPEGDVETVKKQEDPGNYETKDVR